MLCCTNQHFKFPLFRTPRSFAGLGSAGWEQRFRAGRRRRSTARPMGSTRRPTPRGRRRCRGPRTTTRLRRRAGAGSDSEDWWCSNRRWFPWNCSVGCDPERSYKNSKNGRHSNHKCTFRWQRKVPFPTKPGSAYLATVLLRRRFGRVLASRRRRWRLSLKGGSIPLCLTGPVLGIFLLPLIKATRFGCPR